MDARGNISRACELIRSASSLVISSGSGMGVDSGLPDFRGPHGIWVDNPVYEKYNLNFLELANPSLLKESPELFWGFYGYRHNLYHDVEPHLGFSIVREWMKNTDSFAITSNVDGHFQKVGIPEEKVWEVHGSINWNQKTKTYFSRSKPFVDGMPQFEDLVPSEYIDVDMETMKARHIPTKDGEILRPNILMFGDMGWNISREMQQQENYINWLKQADLSNLVAVEIGAGVQLPTIRMLTSRLLREINGTLIRINPVHYEVHKSSDIGIKGTALDTLFFIDTCL